MLIHPGDFGAAAFLGLRLRALDQAITAQSKTLLSVLGVETPHPGVATLQFIAVHEPATVTDVIVGTGLSRQLVLQRLNLLEGAGLIESAPDNADRRVRRIRLTAKGRAHARKLAEALPVIEAVFQELDEEIGIALSDALISARKALDRRGLDARAVNFSAVRNTIRRTNRRSKASA